MLDEDIVAVSPSSVYRILKAEGLLNQWNTLKRSSKGLGFKHTDSSSSTLAYRYQVYKFPGSFLFLISVMDGYSRYILHHEVRANMTKYDVELTIQRAKEKYPECQG